MGFPFSIAHAGLRALLGEARHLESPNWEVQTYG
jgi:hypothetical protein